MLHFSQRMEWVFKHRAPEKFNKIWEKKSFFRQVFHLKKKFQNFFLNFYPKSFPDIKNRNGFSKTGHLKILIKFKKKNQFFGKCSTLKKNFEYFFLIFTPNPSLTPKIGMVFWHEVSNLLIWYGMTQRYTIPE